MSTAKSCSSCAHHCSTSARCGAYDGLPTQIARDLVGLCGPQAVNHAPLTPPVPEWWRLIKPQAAARIEPKDWTRGLRLEAQAYPHAFAPAAPYQHEAAFQPWRLHVSVTGLLEAVLIVGTAGMCSAVLVTIGYYAYSLATGA